MNVVEQVARVALAEGARMAWFTVAGVTVAALIKTYQLDRKVRQYVGGAGPWGIVVATAIGLICPLCSCGILPVVIPMALSGVPIPPLLALLITSPVMDPASFALTWGGLGEALAWWKLGGAALLGLSAGFGALALEKVGVFSGNLVRLKPLYGPAGALAPAAEIACANGFSIPSMTVVPRESRVRFFLDRFRDVGSFVALWVGLSILLDAVVQVVVPLQWITWLVGRKGLGSILAAAAIGLPLPLNQIAAVPVVAGLQARGIALGADLALLIAGPVASLPALFALTATFKPRVVVFYLSVCFGGAVALGLARMALG